LTERLQAQRLVAAETEPPTEKVPPTEMFSPSIPAESTALGAGDACAEGVGIGAEQIDLMRGTPRIRSAATMAAMFITSLKPPPIK